tara:strand:+ start:1190 stop:1372 length:183 start_codon:yes stop_codon:yes gene_type:complete
MDRTKNIGIMSLKYRLNEAPVIEEGLLLLNHEIGRTNPERMKNTITNAFPAVKTWNGEFL